MLALFGKPTSINVRKVLWLCAELRLAIEHDPAPSARRLAGLNPNLQVPVLRDEAGGRELDWPFDAARVRAWLAAG
ncbi:TPA: glutathione S-transferase N-terminal domain-containing protein [Escherichia coli]|nr:glutathione S-transferase N-terminal domain-containing protein [Escherichia coli]